MKMSAKLKEWENQDVKRKCGSQGGTPRRDSAEQ